jgi:hypothetical protein
MKESLSSTEVERPSKLAKLDADEASICLHQLTWLGSTDFASFLTILHKIHALLAQNKVSDPSSLCSLGRVLTLRLGGLTGLDVTVNDHVAEIVSLSFQCLRYCFPTTTFMDPSEVIITFQTVLQLLDTFVGQTDDLGRNALDLFQIWLSTETTSSRSAWSKGLAHDRSILEEMLLVLVKIASSKKHPTMAMEIQNFLRRYTGRDNANAIHPSLFEIALHALDESSNPCLPINKEEEEEDQLFMIQCLALTEHRRPTMEQIETVLSLFDSTKDTTVSRAMQILQHCCHYLTETQRDKCTQMIMERVMDPKSSEQTMLPALDCMEGLLMQRSTPLTMANVEELLDLCSNWAFDEPTFDQPLQTRAASISLLLIGRNFPNASTTTKKHRFVRILSQILLSSPSTDLTSRAIALACEWIDNTETRREIWDILPHLVNALTYLIFMDRVAPCDSLAILQTISTMVQCSDGEPSSPTRIVERSLPKLLDALVAILQRSPATSDHHPMAMNLLLIFSQNPCHRRILANHPGVLSSMIHFLRSHRSVVPISEESHSPKRRPPPPPKQGDMKRQVLLIAQAL